MAIWGSERIFAAVLSDAPTDDEWDRWIALLLTHDSGVLRVVVDAHHSGPDAKQRKRLTEAMRGIDVRVAVMTESTFVRGIITALAWMGIPQRGFPPGHLLQAANYLELKEAELEQMLEQLTRLRQEAGVDGARAAPS